MKTPAILAALALAVPVLGDDLIWDNVQTFPADIQNTGEAWSCIRSEPPNFVSYRVAADDFILDQPMRITRINFFSVAIGVPAIVGGDWYIYAVSPAGGPGALIAAGSSVPLDHSPSGLNNPNYGIIYNNIMEVDDLVLPAGNYFLAFRTYQTISLVPNEKNNNAGLTTRVVLGTQPAYWNFGVLADGSVLEPWVPMQVFNLNNNNEWAFRIYGESLCYPDCEGDGDLDLFDYLCFQGLFANQDPYADCEKDGDWDLFDYLCFQGSFASGCD